MQNGKIIKTDILVAGSGIAGIKAALTASKEGMDVFVISKTKECASNHVLGFNAVLSPDDSTNTYYNDTLLGGGKINNKELIKLLAQNAKKEVEDVEKTNLEFDKDDNGYHLLKPLGCTYPRLAHIGNLTGRITLEKFKEAAEENGVKIKYNAMLKDIIVKDEKVVGATYFDLDAKEIFTVWCKAIIIATGGIHIAKDSTYHFNMTGDGYAASYRAGAYLTDMEFIQYEPCRCIYPKKLGISTTLLAKGGKITNKNGERFLLKYYDSEGEIPKDALAKLIFEEIIKGNATEHNGVYLDLTDIPKDEIIEKHSLYYKRFMNEGIDITKEKIEVAPCAHSFMGGIVIDSDTKTNIDGLFAAGEAAGGIHGANRVGGNAGTEIYVFGTIAGRHSAKYAKENDFLPLEEQRYEKQTQNVKSKQYFEDKKLSLRDLMAKNMGPVRYPNLLISAQKSLENMFNESLYASYLDFDAHVSKTEYENMLTVCILSVKAAIERKESRGVHTRYDFPFEDKEYERNFIHKRIKI